MTVLVTGAAGFIGFHVARALIDRGDAVLGIDDLNPYYDVALKHARLDRLAGPSFRFVAADIADPEALGAIVAGDGGINRIVHLAAQAGVRHSVVAPFDYAKSNLVGHLAVLETARRMPGLRHMVYASSSSVYGASRSLPFAEDDRADTPLSLYAASKRAGEHMAYAYAHQFHLKLTGLRFFTVYGPWGRPDMAYFAFADAIMAGRPITVYDGGAVRRDFTYIDDVAAAVLRCLDRPPGAGSVPPALVLNVGNNRSEPVTELIGLLEAALGRRAELRSVPRPPADVAETRADLGAIAEWAEFAPRTPLSAGIPRFASWFLDWRAGGR